MRALIREHIGSVGELELLLALRGDPARVWTAGALCDALSCPEPWVRLQLGAMSEGGLVEPVAEGWRFAPAAPELEQAADALEEAYRTQTRAVVRFIFATP